MMHLLAIGGSNSRSSINRNLALFTAKLFTDADVETLDISDLQIPLFSVDAEKEEGMPEAVLQVVNQLDRADFIVLSLAENNNSFNAGFKNLYDWISRIKDRKVFSGKPMLLMAASPGPGGGMIVLEHAKNIFPRAGADIKATFSLPAYYQNFDNEKGVTNSGLLQQLKQIVKDIEGA